MKIEFNLLTNAIDSIEHAIELLAWKDEEDDARRLKQAVLSISHGVELLLKERLRRVHPVLIWENVDRFPSLSARTVTVDTALSRLINIGCLQFTDHDFQLIKSLRDTRNAIEHYSWTATKGEVDKIVGQALGFSLSFADKELGHEFFGYHTRKDDTFQSLIESNPEFAKAIIDRDTHQTKIRGEFSLLCDYCHAIAANPSTGACKICGHWNKDLNDPSFDDIPF